MCAYTPLAASGIFDKLGETDGPAVCVCARVYARMYIPLAVRGIFDKLVEADGPSLVSVRDLTKFVGEFVDLCALRLRVGVIDDEDVAH